MAPASRSRPIGWWSSTALIDAWSMSSIIEARSRAPMATTTRAASATSSKVATRVAGGCLRRHEPERRPRHDAERALAADEELDEREPGGVLDPLAPEAHEGAVGQHDVQPEHVVGGDAVLHAAQPPGVGRDVAADRADLEGRRVGWIPEPVPGGGLLDLDVEGARLDDGGAGGRVDLDGAHPLEAEHDAAVDRVGATGQSAAGPARHERYAVDTGPADGGLHVGRAASRGPRRAAYRRPRRR